MPTKKKSCWSKPIRYGPDNKKNLPTTIVSHINSSGPMSKVMRAQSTHLNNKHACQPATKQSNASVASTEQLENH